MIRSKKITVVSILAVIVSVVSLISSSFALRATLDNGVSSVMSPHLNSSAVLDFNVYLGETEIVKNEGCVFSTIPLVQDNTILLSFVTEKKESFLDLSFTIVNEGDVDGLISQISVIGLPEDFSYKIEGIQVGDSISKKSRIGVTMHLQLVRESLEEFIEPISLDSVQIVFTFEK